MKPLISKIWISWTSMSTEKLLELFNWKIYIWIGRIFNTTFLRRIFLKTLIYSIAKWIDNNISLERIIKIEKPRKKWSMLMLINFVIDLKKGVFISSPKNWSLDSKTYSNDCIKDHFVSFLRKSYPGDVVSSLCPKKSNL